MAVTTIHMEVEFEFTLEMLDQILVTAFDGAYGGSNYWARQESIGEVNDPKGGESRWNLVCILDDGKLRIVDNDVVTKGLKVFIEKDFISKAHLVDLIQGEATDFDAHDADTIVQLGLFEEVRYA